MQHGSRRHFDRMDVLAIQIKIIEGRQSDQRYRHFAEHGRQCGKRPLEILSPRPDEISKGGQKSRQNARFATPLPPYPGRGEDGAMRRDPAIVHEL